MSCNSLGCRIAKYENCPDYLIFFFLFSLCTSYQTRFAALHIKLANRSRASVYREPAPIPVEREKEKKQQRRLFEQGPSKLSLKALITVYPLQWLEMFFSVGSVCGSSFFSSGDSDP